MRYRLLLLIFLAFVLRLTALGEQSLWYDEGVTWWLARLDDPIELIRWTAADIQPPLYYLLIWLSRRLFGASEWSLRFPSVIFGVLSLPLIAVLARQLWPGGRAALLAALLLALSPLMIYHSQEARMYTLLLFEAILSSYLLLRWLEGEEKGWGYAAVAAAALYTHYFALFLIGTHLLYAVWRLRGDRARLAGAMTRFGLAGLLFAPWLPVIAARLGDDPSYWPGALKLNEATRHILISFTAGETVPEQTGYWLALGYLLVIMGGWLGSWLTDRFYGRSRPALPGGFLLLWLFVPIAAILALSYQTPKFNPRYALLAWPAFLLILAGSLARLRRMPLLFGPALLFILFANGLGLYNWFTDPRFARDQFRQAAHFVESHITAGETVLLSSGHMFPVWQYYYGPENWTPLPNIERLDVDRVVGLDVAAELAPALKGKGGVWLVTWQDEVTDPNGIIPFWLARIGHRPEPGGDPFWGVDVAHWRLNPARLERLAQSPLDHPARFNFAGQVDLLGFTQLSDTELALFWQARQPLPEEMLLSLRLTDRQGFDWDRETQIERPGAYLYPPSRWPVGQMVMTRQPLAWQIGTPPGLYRAEAGLGRATESGDFIAWDILDEQGRPQRRTAPLEPVRLNRLIRVDSEPPLPDAAVDLGPVGAARRVLLSTRRAEPGDRLLLVVHWQIEAETPSLTLELVDSGQTVFPVAEASGLPAGDLVLGQYWLDIPPQAVAGPARLRIRPAGSDKSFLLARLEILPTERTFTLPATLQMELAAIFGNQIELIGADCDCQTEPGQSVPLILYWRAETGPETNYTVFTHLLGPQEAVIVNADHAPPKPTQGWVPGEILADPVRLVLPPELPPGDYAIEVGLYDATDPAYPRLPRADGSTRLILPHPLRVE